MSELINLKRVTDCLEGPQSTMEKMLLEEYLHKQGYTMTDLHTLPEAEARAIMTEACKYASLKLAEVESVSHFREKIRGPD